MENNKIRIYERNDIESLPECGNPYMGWFYAVEYGDKLKIGSTTKPKQRIKTLKAHAEYGDLMIGKTVLSEPHTNYLDNERMFHNLFRDFRVGKTELFKVGISDFVSKCSGVQYETEKLKSTQEREKRFNGLMTSLFGERFKI